MKLTIKDRVLFGILLQEKGSILEMLTTKDIKAKVELSDEDKLKIELSQTSTGGLNWKENIEELEAEFSEAEKSLIKKQIDKLDSEKNITIEVLDLVNKFM